MHATTYIALTDSEGAFAAYPRENLVQRNLRLQGQYDAFKG